MSRETYSNPQPLKSQFSHVVFRKFVLHAHLDWKNYTGTKIAGTLRELSVWILRSPIFACELPLDHFRLGSFAWVFVRKISLGITRLQPFSKNMSFGDLRWGSFVWGKTGHLEAGGAVGCGQMKRSAHESSTAASRTRTRTLLVKPS